jgi:hypothetical protein
MKTIIKTVLFSTFILCFSLSKAQWKDSATYKQAVIQYYKQQTTGLKTYKYVPNAFTKLEQDTMFTNALAWKKEYLEHPMILAYYNFKKGTPEGEAKIRYLEDTANKKEYSEVMIKAAEQYAAKNKPKPQPKHVAPGLSTTPSSSGKIENKDKEVKEQVLKNWKF